MSANQQLPRQFGKYVLVRKIAMGGMAEIFKAKAGGAEGFEKDVVIKRILPHFTEDGDFVKMFIDEADITSKLQHANIVQIFDFDVCENSYYIAMELIEGVDLKKILDVGVKDEKPLSPAQAVWILMETSKGLHYAHVKEHKGQPLNIVHRDISPHNLMVSYNGEVKLMDFGIAKAAQRSTKTMAGTVKGKVAYMSPEQARGKTLDGRSDLFALGILLWEMLTGKRLFLGDSDFETLSNVLKFEPPLPSTLNPRVNGALDDIVLKALSKNRDERHATVEEFARDLTKWYYATVTDLEAESLKRYMHDLFAADIETNRRLATEERAALGGGDAGSGPPPSEPDDNAERTLALPAADAAKTLLEGDLTAEALQNALKKQPPKAAPAPQQPVKAATPSPAKPPASGAPARPATPAPAPTPAAPAPTPAPAPSGDAGAPKSKAWLWILLLLLVGGGGAFFALSGGDKPAPKPEVAATAAAAGDPASAAPGSGATTPPAAPVDAVLAFEVEPANATVTVDGQAANGGKVSGLKLGASVEVVAKADGFEPFTKTVTMDSASVKLPIKLAPIAAQVAVEPAVEPKQDVVAKVAATLKIGLDPSGADVKTSLGTVTMSSRTEAVITGLSQGETVEVTVSKAGFDARKESIAITGPEQTHAVKLKATDAAKPAATSAPAPNAAAPSAAAPSAAAASAKGTLQISARPWAKVSINGRPAGDTPVVRQLPPNTYTVVLTKGAQSVTKTVRLEAGKTARVDHRFE
jgi:serine/threonine protein kinase